MTSISLAKARGAVDKIRGDAALGIDVVAVRKALRKKASEHKTLDQAFADFISGERHKSKTAGDYRSLWALYVAGRLGRKSIEDITADDVGKLHASTAAAVTTRAKEKANNRIAKGRTTQSQSAGCVLKPMASDAWKGHRTANKVVALLRAVLGAPDGKQTILPEASLGSSRRRVGDA